MAEINNQVTPEMLEEIAQSGGLKHVVFTAEGAKVEDVPQASIDRAEKNALAQASKVADKNRVFELLRPKEDALVVAKEVEIGDEIMVFHIKQLGYADCSRIDAKRHRRKPNGQLEFDQSYAETVGIAWQIFSTLVKDANEGKADEGGNPLKPDWVPMFTMDEILGTGKQDGLMTLQSPEAKEFLYGITSAIWSVVPEWNPLSQASAAAQLGMT